MFQLSQIYVVLHEVLSPRTAVLWKCFTLRDTGLRRSAFYARQRFVYYMLLRRSVKGHLAR